MARNLTDSLLNISVEYDEYWLLGGTKNTRANSILQGIFTVLALKEVVSLMRLWIKGSRKFRIKSNGVILWEMAENWEDLFKMARMIFRPRRIDGFTSFDGHGNDMALGSRKLNSFGRRRLILASFIATLIFGLDFALVFLTLPSKTPINGSNFQVAAWDTMGSIEAPTSRTLIRGSRSRPVFLESKIGGVEFFAVPSISIERTDFEDFQIPLSKGTLPLANCTVEKWRLICRTLTQNRYYQYKLRLDLTPRDSMSEYFAPTNKFAIGTDKDRAEQYRAVIEKVLKNLKAVPQDTRFRLETNMNASNSTTFVSSMVIQADKTASDVVSMAGEKNPVRVHDVVASIIINSIRILPTSSTDPKMVQRKSGTRAEIPNSHIMGVIAESQRPLLPLYGIIFTYILLQGISVFFQTNLKFHVHNPEIYMVIERAGGVTTENYMNADLDPIDLRYTTARVMGTAEERARYYKNPNSENFAALQTSGDNERFSRIAHIGFNTIREQEMMLPLQYRSDHEFSMMEGQEHIKGADLIGTSNKIPPDSGLDLRT